MSQDARYDEEISTQRRAVVLGLDYVDTSQIENKVLYRDILPVDQLKNLRVIPLQVDKSNILFGITTTTSQQTLQSLTKHFSDQRLAYSIISDSGYRDYILLYDPPKKIEYNEIEIGKEDSGDAIGKVSEILSQVRSDDILAYLVQQAHNLKASDIHLETTRNNARIRYRIDGVLHPIAELDFDKYRLLVSSIASAGNVSTSSMDAQQGHIAQKITMADGSFVDVNVRLETVQTINGMDVVMRLFNMSPEMYNLDSLGLSASERKVVDEIISKPSGLVLIVGPTGSGKTTTLYSMLNSLSNIERKIITIEDPVEYQFDGITQIPVVQANPDIPLNFADKIKAVLRLDPDIIMVGEIRDKDTSRTALQAALTGHLVLSTFHASSASAALTRMSDVIGQNPLFISAIRLIMAQRLLRRLDDKTKIAYEPTMEELTKLTAVVDTLPSSIEKPNLQGIKLYKPGSSDENPFGYQGQIAIREQLVITDSIRGALEDPQKIASTNELEKAAIKGGMMTMEQDATLKVIAGITSFEEVFRVIG